MGQIDTFDPKAKGLNKGTPKKAGSLYDSIPTAVRGVRVCEHLTKTADLMDRVTAVRTVNHKVIDEHAFATNLVHTGRVTSGNVVYPSIGSIVAHERGAGGPGRAGVHPHRLPERQPRAGLPRLEGRVRLPHRHHRRPRRVHPPSRRGREAGRRADAGYSKRSAAQAPTGSAVAEYEAAQAEALRLAGPGFLKHFDLTTEPAKLRESYGGEFGQRCLLARRLVEAGVRFVEVSHNLNFLNGTGWDVHNDGINNQHLLDPRDGRGPLGADPRPRSAASGSTRR